MNPWITEAKSISEIKDFSQLCRYPIVQKTMFVGNCSYIDLEYKYVTCDPQFAHKWDKLLEVQGYGNPERYFYNTKTSGNTIHMVHHLAMFEARTGTTLESVKKVYEFGGGFGNMAEVISNYTKAEYTIQDLQPCLNMQRIYLKNTCPNGKFIFTLNPIIADFDLFISTWALSECDLDIREKVNPIIERSKKVLIAYAATFDNFDNIGYFTELSKKITSHTWQNFCIPTMDTNHYYLFGRNFYKS